DNSKRGACGAIELQLTLGPATMVTPFVIMDIIPTFKAILGRPWVKQTLGVLSALHQSYKFPHNGKILKVKSLPQVETVNMITAEDLPPSTQMKLKEPMVNILDVGNDDPAPLPHPGGHLGFPRSSRRIGSVWAWRLMKKMGTNLGKA